MVNGMYIFLSNLVMNTFLLALSAAVLKTTLSKWRCGSAAALGAAYALGELYFYELEWLIFKAILFFLMVWTAFGFHNLRLYLKRCGVFLLATVILGGGVGLVCQGQMTKGLSVTIHILILLLMPLSMMMVRRIRAGIIKSRALRALVIDHGGKQISIKAFEDTGNMLSEPVTGLPVVIVEERMLCLWSAEKLRGVSVLPFRTISGEDGSMVAFKPDGVSVDGKQIECFIGIYKGKLSYTDEYQAIVNPLLI